MSIEITNQVRIQTHPEFWYTVEDTNVDVGGFGCTISYWEDNADKGEKRVVHICMDEKEALSVADAIYKLFKEN